MNITSISTYQPEDEEKIREAYTLESGEVDYASIEAAIQNNDASIAPVEDLLSFVIDNTGDLPEILLSSPDEVSFLWEDETVTSTLQEWRRESGYSQEFIDHVTNFLNLGGAETGTIADAEDFLSRHQTDTASLGTVQGGAKYDNVTNLVTNMMTLMMKFGSPGMALLAYVIGFDAVINQEDVDDSTQYSLENQELIESDLPGQNVFVEVQGDLTVTQNATTPEDVSIDGPMGTADEVEGPAVGYVVNTGLGDVVKNLQGTAIDVIADAQDAWDDLINDLGDIPDDPNEAQVYTQEKQKDISNIQKVIQAMEEFIKNSQDILNSVIETASVLNQKQAQVWMDVIRNI